MEGEIMGKKRFGISIDEDLADKLDELSKALSTDRSAIVEDAIRGVIAEHSHYLYEHECKGIMILVYSEGKGCSVFVRQLIEDFKDIIQFSSHYHTGNNCTEVFFIAGNSLRIRDLHSEAKKRKDISVRYLPISEIR
jgi:CopG family nickel-responsive transcriptional regulator